VDFSPAPEPPEPLLVRLERPPPPPPPPPAPPEKAAPPEPRPIATHRRHKPSATVVAQVPQMLPAQPAFSPPPPMLAPPIVAPQPAPAAPPAPPQPAPHQLPPPRMELVYTVLYGGQKFTVGGSRYRFSHENGRYRLEHDTTATGLARLAFRGVYRMQSRGTITPQGLRPDEISIERGGPDKRELGRFDWNANTVQLRDGKKVPLKPPAYDVLSLFLTFYFAPPQNRELRFQVASPSRLYDFVFERVGEEKVQTSMGNIPTQHWKRRTQDPSELQAELWLSPDFDYIPVKIRLFGDDRGEAEEVLDGIFAAPPDEPGKTMP
jgi:hypothetical protein